MYKSMIWESMLNETFINPFKSHTLFQDRLNQATAIREKFPFKAPIIVQKHHTETDLIDIDRSKFLVSFDYTSADLIRAICHRLHRLSETKALFFLTESGKILQPNKSISVIYEENKDEDGFLYIFYHSENTFGFNPLT
jgi:GABA(A) receptor-associated protein